MKKLLTYACLAIGLMACNSKQEQPIISSADVEFCKQWVLEQYPETNLSRAERGISQVARLWTKEDGESADFIAFVQTNFAGDTESRQNLYASLSRIFEQLNEKANTLCIELQRPAVLTNAGDPTPVDYIMAGYSTTAHVSEDLFKNKVAFITILNFPNYTLEEKNTMGVQWSRQQWAEVRMGDLFPNRIPASVWTEVSRVEAQSDEYIANYNIYMDCLRTEDGQQLWKDHKILLSHWNLRDEIKSHYATGNVAKQEMIYQVMQRIVRQEIPQSVINSGEYIWQPYSNTTAVPAREPDTRYQHILNYFHACLAMDAYCPQMPTGILRNFDGQMEIPAEQIESLFQSLLSSDEVNQVAQIIRFRLGRDLRPFDIWYDGFKARGSINEDELTEQVRGLYPDCMAYEKGIAQMLQNLGWSSELAREINSHIVVEPARGSGHACPCVGRGEPARLRTRIPEKGMDYKGYNIAVHEMGHNVEEVTSLYMIDHYMLAGIPNTGFTEASAFLFQNRDLQLLGRGCSTLDANRTLDIFWGMYEIMGVSLVDMYMWRWLYAHQDATAAQLREAVLQISAQVWNEYYYPVLGEKDCVLLGIYSHMVSSPMYLPFYPIGHLVHFQLEQFLRDKSNSDFADEYTRIYRLGRLTPSHWMQQAVGGDLSVEPVLQAVREAVQMSLPLPEEWN